MNATGLLHGFGRLSLGLALVGLVATPFGLHPDGRSLTGYLFTLCLMALVSAGLMVAARLRQRQDPLAPRAVPSCLVAYGLFVLIALRWWFNP